MTNHARVHLHPPALWEIIRLANDAHAQREERASGPALTDGRKGKVRRARVRAIASHRSLSLVISHLGTTVSISRRCQVVCLANRSLGLSVFLYRDVLVDRNSTSPRLDPIRNMSDNEQQAKAATPEDVVMEEEEAPVTDGQEPVPAAEEETEAKESDDKAAASEQDSKPKSKTSQSAKKGNGTSSRKIAGKFAKADAKVDANQTGKFKVGDLVTGRVKGYPFWREYSFRDSVFGR